MKKYYLLLILLTVSLQVYCKTIRGEVVDSLGLPVPFSTIVVDHSQKIGTTNKYGRFVFGECFFGQMPADSVKHRVRNKAYNCTPRETMTSSYKYP